MVKASSKSDKAVAKRLKRDTSSSELYPRVIRVEPGSVPNRFAEGEAIVLFFSNGRSRAMGLKDFRWNESEFSKSFREVSSNTEFMTVFLSQSRDLNLAPEPNVLTASSNEGQPSTSSSSVQHGSGKKRKLSQDTPGTSKSTGKETEQPPLLYKVKKPAEKKKEQEDSVSVLKDVQEKIMKSCHGTFLIRIENLTLAEQVRDVDPLFLEKLSVNMLENPSHCYQPLAVVIDNLEETSNFSAADVNGYHYKILGGQHNFLAAKSLSEKHPEMTLFQSRLCTVYHSTISDDAAYVLAKQHNDLGEFRHTMSLKDEVAFCRGKFLEGKDGWEKSCAMILGKDKKSRDLKTLMCLASLTEETYKGLSEVFCQHRNLNIKGLTISAGSKKLSDLKLYAFRPMISLPEGDKVNMLHKLSSGEITTREFQEECSLMGQLQKLQVILMDITDTKTWEEAERKFPQFTTRDKLIPFTPLQKGKLDSFKKFCRRLKAKPNEAHQEISVEGKAGTRGFLLKGDVLSLRSEKVEEIASESGGIDLAILDLAKKWKEEDLRQFCVRLRAINLSEGATDYTTVVLVPVEKQHLVLSVLKETGQFRSVSKCFFATNNKNKGKDDLMAECVGGMVIATSKQSTRTSIEWLGHGNGNFVSCATNASLRDEDGTILDDSEKPSHLYDVLIQSLSEELNWVLDAGSSTGTGLLASLRLRRNAVFLTDTDIHFPYIKRKAMQTTKGEASEKTVDMNMSEHGQEAEEEMQSETREDDSELSKDVYEWNDSDEEEYEEEEHEEEEYEEEEHEEEEHGEEENAVKKRKEAGDGTLQKWMRKK